MTTDQKYDKILELLQFQGSEMVELRCLFHSHTLALEGIRESVEELKRLHAPLTQEEALRACPVLHHGGPLSEEVPGACSHYPLHHIEG